MPAGIQQPLILVDDAPEFWSKDSLTTQLITSTPTAIPWDGNEYADSQHIMWDVGTPTRLLAQSDGIYFFSAAITAFAPTDERVQVAFQWYVNGAAVGPLRGGAYIRNTGSAWDYWPVELAATPMALSKDDYVELYALQVTGGVYGGGGALTVRVDGTHSQLWAYKA